MIDLREQRLALFRRHPLDRFAILCELLEILEPYGGQVDANACRIVRLRHAPTILPASPIPANAATAVLRRVGGIRLIGRGRRGRFSGSQGSAAVAAFTTWPVTASGVGRPSAASPTAPQPPQLDVLEHGRVVAQDSFDVLELFEVRGERGLSGGVGRRDGRAGRRLSAGRSACRLCGHQLLDPLTELRGHRFHAPAQLAGQHFGLEPGRIANRAGVVPVRVVGDGAHGHDREQEEDDDQSQSQAHGCFRLP